jgi:mono/diheme cytochrome c family protein
MRMPLSNVGLAAVAFLLSSAAHAQDVAEGQHIAQTWCSGCHEVNNQIKTARGDAAAPTFKSIAQMNSTTQMSLAAFLSTPHLRMPNYVLSQTDIENVSAYIVSLRGTRRTTER